MIDDESFEDAWPPTGWSATGVWNKESDEVYDRAYSADFDGQRSPTQSGDLTTPDVNCSDAASITVEFYGYEDGVNDTEYYLDYYDGTGWDQITRLDNLGSGSWEKYSNTITDSQYFKSDFKIRFRAVDQSNREHSYVDLVTIKKAL